MRLPPGADRRADPAEQKGGGPMRRKCVPVPGSVFAAMQFWRISLLFLQTTPNLLIYFKRYYYDSTSGNGKKIESDINFDEVIEIGDTETDRKKYEIMSIIVHSGDCDGGHYICYVKIDGEWYLFDDSNTTKIGNFATVRDYKLYNSYEAGAKKAYFISAKLIEENKKD